MCGFCRSGGGLVWSMLYVIKNEIIYLHLRFCVNVCMYLYTVSTFTCIYMYTLCIYKNILIYKIIPHILIHPNPTLSVVFCWLPRSLVAYTSSSSSLKAVFTWGEKCASQAKTHESWKKGTKKSRTLDFSAGGASVCDFVSLGGGFTHIWTNIFQRGWNHQLVVIGMLFFFAGSPC